jgi:AhpD family alkylhydroperoxidase
MKTATILSITLAFAATHAQLAAADTPKKDPTAAAAAAATKEIEAAFGFVPGFIRAIPKVVLPSWWEGTKALEMNPNTALDGKTKELIGLAVAAQIPCEYCVYFHTEAAKLEGASEEEVQEAVAMASATRAGSTILNGLQVDKVQFKKDVDRIVKSAKKAQPHARK